LGDRGRSLAILVLDTPLGSNGKGGNCMPTYISLINFTGQGIGTIRDTLGQKYT
jgi:hypothetical protein